MYFGNYGVPKTWLDQWLKSPVSGVSVEKQHAKCPPTLFIFEGQSLYPMY